MRCKISLLRIRRKIGSESIMTFVSMAHMFDSKNNPTNILRIDNIL